MKLAEALMLRSDYQVRVEKLKTRIMNNVKIQEDEEYVENPNDLLIELEDIMSKLNDIIIRINKTNNLEMLDDKMTISEGLSIRDNIALKRRIFEETVNAASIQQNRFSRSEIKFVTTIDVKKMQKKIDDLSKQFRELDTKIQGKNWMIDLVE